jgi:hypothetical protein
LACQLLKQIKIAPLYRFHGLSFTLHKTSSCSIRRPLLMKLTAQKRQSAFRLLVILLSLQPSAADRLFAAAPLPVSEPRAAVDNTTGRISAASRRKMSVHKKKSTSSGTALLPTWRDSLIKSDVSLFPAATQSSQPVNQGYYPTQNDLSVLGDRDYPRRGGYQDEGPDAALQNAMGIFPYQSGGQDFYTRNAASFTGANRVLGVFAPQQGLTYESPTFPSLAVSLDGNIPNFLTRTFAPSKAHVKAGPLAFDLLWVGAGAVWSEYHGHNSFPPGKGPGWVGYVDFALRGYLRLTDTLHLSWAANLMYLPGTNELAFRTLNNGYPQIYLTANYQKRVGSWDYYIGERFFARPGLDIFSGITAPGSDQAGRYQFGYYGGNTQTGFYQTQNVWFVNQLQMRATSMVGLSDWRFWGDYLHTDFWKSFGFSDHQYRDTYRASLGYEGNAIPFSPMLSYQLMTLDGYNSFWNQVQLQGTGRITENLRLQASAGYLWTSGAKVNQDNFIWSLGLMHQFSQKGSHGIQVGQQLLTDSYTPESIFVSYYRYYLSYQVATRIQASAYAQLSNGNRIVSANPGTYSNGSVDGYIMGGSLQYQPFDFTRVVLSTTFQRSDGSLGYMRTDRWIHRIQLMQQLASRLTLQGAYQYEEMNSTQGFNEHFFSIGLRRYF